jgi:hypothetical protein
VSDIPLTKEWFEFWLREHVAPGGNVHPPLSELRVVVVAAEREMLRWAAEKESTPAKGAGH